MNSDAKTVDDYIIGVPEKRKEAIQQLRQLCDVQKGLLFRLKQFILELGRDFQFVGEEYRLQVGMHIIMWIYIFYHREFKD